MTQSLYEQVQELALEKYAGDKEQATAFTEAFIKQAFFGELNKEAAAPVGFMGKLFEGAGQALGAGAIGLGLGLGMHGLSSAIRGANDMGLRSKFEQALHSAVQGNEMLRHALTEHPGRVEAFADTLFKFAPHVVCDPNVLAHLLVNAVQGESVDIATIKTISELENRYTENRRNSLFAPKQYSK